MKQEKFSPCICDLRDTAASFPQAHKHEFPAYCSFSCIDLGQELSLTSLQKAQKVSVICRSVKYGYREQNCKFDLHDLLSEKWYHLNFIPKWGYFLHGGGELKALFIYVWGTQKNLCKVFSMSMFYSAKLFPEDILSWSESQICTRLWG